MQEETQRNNEIMDIGEISGMQIQPLIDINEIQSSRRRGDPEEDGIVKELKRGKPNDFISLDEMNFSSPSQNRRTGIEEEVELPSILEKVEAKKEFKSHGLAMSNIIGFRGDQVMFQGGLSVLGGRVEDRPVPVKKENEVEELEGDFEEKVEVDIDELDEFLKEYNKEEQAKEVKVELEEQVSLVKVEERAPVILEEATDDEERDKMIEEIIEMQESTEQKEEERFNFANIRGNMSYRRLKPDFSSKYKLKIQEHMDEDGDSIEGVEFYWNDMSASFSNPDRKYITDILHIFGKIKVQNKGKQEIVSACITVKNIERVVYVVKKNQASFSKFKEEVKNKIDRLSFKEHITITKKNKRYCFDLNINSGKVECLELRYPYKFGKLRIPFRGNNYNGVFGESFDPVQTTLLEKGLKGPNWILVKDYELIPKNKGSSWCKVNLEIDSIEDFDILPVAKPRPNLKFLALSLETTLNKNSKYSEIKAVSILEFDIDEDNNILEGIHPYMFYYDQRGDMAGQSKAALEIKRKFKLGETESQIYFCDSEIHLLRLFLQKVSIMDPDGFLSHDLSSSFLDILMDRMKFRDISMRDKISRIKKSSDVMNFWARSKGTKKIRNLTHGRLVLDSFPLISEFSKERDYALENLSKKYLKEETSCLAEPFFLQKTEKKIQNPVILFDDMITHCYLSINLTLKLKLIELTEQLTKVSGCLWDTSLRNMKLNRNEMLLLHEFNALNYILPDYYPYSATKTQKEKIKTETYQGGLVYQPQRGLYTNYVLMLDFNSLYPSIIREFKICFTTVKRQKVGIDFYLNREDYDLEYIDIDLLQKDHNPQKIDDSVEGVSLLPKVVKKLIEDRKSVKRQMKNLDRNDQDSAYRFLDTKQQALKVISNSIYGCLGSPFSRFYSRSLAELVTYYGRSLLERSGKAIYGLGCEIVYGDTDSIFIDTKTDNFKNAMKMGKEAMKRINRNSKSGILEIGIDGVYKRLLLNNKKRYSGLCITNAEELLEANGEEVEPQYKMEVKGMDVIRREWCDLSKETGNSLLNLILSDEDNFKDEIYKILERVSKQLSDESKVKEVPISKLTMHQKLNKSLHLYTSDTIPFVNVARKLVENQNLRENQLVGKVIPYLICKGESSSTPVYNRAYHPDEYLSSQKEDRPLTIDGKWYLASQIAKPVMRILENVKQISKRKVESILNVGTLFKTTANPDGNVNTGGVETSNEMEVKDYSAFYDNDYCPSYSLVNWEALEADKKIRKQTLTFSTLKSEKFKKVNPMILKNNFNLLASKITKQYYSDMQMTCINCDENQHEYSMVEETECEDCDLKLVVNKSPRATNGNFYYLDQIFDKAVKLPQVDEGMKQLIRSDIQPKIRKIRQLSGYQRMSLGDALKGNLVRNRRRRPTNRHYKLLAITDS